MVFVEPQHAFSVDGPQQPDASIGASVPNTVTATSFIFFNLLYIVS